MSGVFECMLGARFGEHRTGLERIAGIDDTAFGIDFLVQACRQFQDLEVLFTC